MNGKLRSSIVVGAGCLACLCLASGCVAPLNTSHFVPRPVTVGKRHRATVFVSATTGTGALQPYYVPSSTLPPTGRAQTVPYLDPGFIDAYRSAVVACLRSSGLFQIATTSGAADMLLDATLVRFQGGYRPAGVLQPGQGTSPAGSVLVVCNWRLVTKNEGVVVCEKDIATTGARGATDGGQPASAVENAASANVRAGIEWLARMMAKQDGR